MTCTTKRPPPRRHILDALIPLDRTLDSVLAELGPREEKILRLYFGTGGWPLTYDELGRVLGLTRMRVNQIAAKALRRVKHGEGAGLPLRVANALRWAGAPEERDVDALLTWLGGKSDSDLLRVRSLGRTGLRQIKVWRARILERRRIRLTEKP